MARYLIPPRTKRESTFIKKITYKDVFIFGICLVLAALAISTNLAGFKWALAVLLILIGFALCLSWGQYHKGYEWTVIIWNYLLSKKKYSKTAIGKMLDFKNEGDVIDLYGQYSAVLEITPIEFLLYREAKQEQVINQFANAIRYVKRGSIVKIEKPIRYDDYLARYRSTYDEIAKEKEEYVAAIRAEDGDDATIDLTEFDARLNILEENIKFLEFTNTEQKIRAEVFYLVIYEADLSRLETVVKDTLGRLQLIGLLPKRLTSPEINEFLQHFIYRQAQPSSVFEMPEVTFDKNSINLGGQKWNVATVGKFPVFAEGNAWAYPLVTVPGTNVVINFGGATVESVTKNVNKAIKELRYRYLNEKDASGQQDLQIQVQSLMTLLQQFQLGNESVHNANFYVMYKDSDAQSVTQAFHNVGYFLNHLKFRQFEGFTSMLPFVSKELVPRFSRQIQSLTLAASFPFINSLFMDKEGDYLGDFRYPIFWDIWQRGQHRVNSNLFEIGQSGSGKTLTMKKILMQQRLRGTKVFVLDCEDEYRFMAKNLGGQTIEMSGGSKINPFQIFPSATSEAGLDDKDTKSVRGDVSSQLIFLSEWFKALLPMEIDAKAMLNNCIAEMYKEAHLTDTTDFSKLTAKHFPTFDTLLQLIKRKEIERSSDKLTTGTYDVHILQRLESYLSMFVGNGLYAALWNGSTELNIKNDFTVFDFQHLFSNSNTEVCNAQMMLLMRMLMREVINVKTINETSDTKQRVIVLVDEAHRYISKQFPIALDTLEQFARRIRKYDGALFVATQNIDDFIGTSEEMRAKASAVINNCQYSMLFSLNADDVNKVQQLYSQYGGGLTAEEINFLSCCERGQMLFLVEPEKRSIVHVGLMPNEWPYIDRGQDPYAA